MSLSCVVLSAGIVQEATASRTVLCCLQVLDKVLEHLASQPGALDSLRAALIEVDTSGLGYVNKHQLHVSGSWGSGCGEARCWAFQLHHM